MADEEEIFDSPTGWVAKHIHNYVETDGQSGHKWQGQLTLLLTTRGRKSGKLRRTALIYGQDGDNYVVVASNGGKPVHPAWYLNLLAASEVEVQVGTDKFTATAHTATGEDRTRLWSLMTSLWSTYKGFQTKTSRELPVVVLTRIP